MNKLMLLGLGVWAFGLTAQAQYYIPSADWYQTGNNQILGDQLGPNNTITIKYPLTRKTSARAGFCGEVIFRLNINDDIGQIKVGEVLYDIPTLPTLLIPACNTSTGLFAEPRPDSFKTANGQIVSVGNTPRQFYTVSSTGVRNLRSNACGFVIVSGNFNYPQRQLTEFVPPNETANFVIGERVLKDAPICRNDSNGIPIGYYPASWLP